MFKKYRDWSCSCQGRDKEWMKRSFSSKNEVRSKGIETETVFTKTEMKNEWNVHFLQRMKCVLKVLKLKLYLPRQKYRMNETFIFFKEWSVF